MLVQNADAEPHGFLFYLVPGFSLLAVSGAVEVLRSANVESGRRLYQWTFAGPNNNPVESSGGVPLAALPVSQCILPRSRLPTTIVICGGDRSHRFRDQDLTAYLHRAANNGAQIGSLSDGAFVVAEAGLFNDHRSTIHWKCLDAYIERHPLLDIRASIVEVDRNRFSCAGGTASLDLMLHFVAQSHGSELVGKIAGNYFHDTVRRSQQVQERTSSFRFAARSQPLTRALTIMDEMADPTKNVAQVARLVGITQRQLGRLFKQHLSTTPAAYFRQLRLRRAGALLRQTGLSISEIAVACGFQSSSHLARHFRALYGETPGNYRRSET